MFELIRLLLLESVNNLFITTNFYFQRFWATVQSVLSGKLQMNEVNRKENEERENEIEWLTRCFHQKNNLIYIIIKIIWNFDLISWNSTKKKKITTYSIHTNSSASIAVLINYILELLLANRYFHTVNLINRLGFWTIFIEIIIIEFKYRYNTIHCNIMMIQNHTK